MAESLISILLIGFCLYISSLALYRLFLSPLSRFPGPTLAALTLWYEFYYDVVLEGRYQYKIKELHRTYGPIIRISPHELHIDDPEFYDLLFVGASVRKTDKYERSAKAFGSSLSAFGTVSHDVHRMRRGALNPLFSKKAVTELIPNILEPKIQKLCRRLGDTRGTGAAVNLVNAYEALTLDIIMEYAFGKSLDHLSHPEFYPNWHFVMRSGSAVFHLGAQWPFIPKLLNGLPEWCVNIMDPRMLAFAFVNNLLMDNLNHARTQGPDVAQHIGHKSIFHSLIDSNLPPIETTNERLVQEAASVVTAGSATTAMALSRTTYELLSRPSELDRLCAELDQIEESQGSQLSVHQLEQLPYLRGVINEGLRLTYGTAHRLMRISPDTPIQYKSWTIPAGTPVGMSNMFMHDNEAIFPSPRSLLPERWLGEQQEQRALERYLVPFSSGSRRCLGANLAYIEILLTLYALFRPGGVGRRMQLSETTIEDVEIYHDLFNAFPKASSRGIRVLIEN